MSRFDIHLVGQYDSNLKDLVFSEGIVALFEHCGLTLSYSKSDIFDLCQKDMQAVNNEFFDSYPSDFYSDNDDIVKFALLPKFFFEIFPNEGITTPFCIVRDRGKYRFSKGWNKAFGCSLLGWRKHNVIMQDSVPLGERIVNDDHLADILLTIDPLAFRNKISIDFQSPNRPEIHVLEKTQDVGYWHRDWHAHNQFLLDNQLNEEVHLVQCESFEDMLSSYKGGVSVHVSPGVKVTQNLLSIARLEISTQRKAGIAFSDSATNLLANRFAVLYDPDNLLRIPCPVYYDISPNRKEIRYS